MVDDPFDARSLEGLFETDTKRPDILKRRESTTLELKANFSRGSDAFTQYARTLAAFSNRCGGYLLFGVQDQPHRLVGMANDHFTQMDPNKLTQFLNNHFAPSVHWDHKLHTYDGKPFGLLYAHEAKSKPVVCTRNDTPLRDGDIYYRYQGETRLIASSDLHRLIEDRIDAERRAWRNLLARTSRSSPSATYVLDLNDGRAVGEARAFVISPELLEQVKFIHEGRFTEAGEPTLRVIGSVDVVRTELLPGTVEEVPVDPSKDCVLWEKDVVAELKARIGDAVEFGPSGTKTLNGFHVRCAVRAHQIPTPSKMYFRPDIPGSRPQYGNDLVVWLEEQYRQDSEFFYKAVETCKEGARQESPAAPPPQASL